VKRRLFVTQSLGLFAGTVGWAFGGVIPRSWASTEAGYRLEDFDWFDAIRQRPVPVRLFLPQRARPTQRVPLVVFSHGLGGSRKGYRYLASHWAKAGIASLHPQHVGSDDDLWRGNPLTLVKRLQSAASESEAQARALDLRFALDRVLASEVASVLDESHIAVAGHSYGANTAMLVSGARVATAAGNMAELRDARIQAAILISAPPLLGQGPLENVLSDIHIPTLHVTSIEDTISIPGFRSTAEDRIAMFHAMSESTRTLVVFNVGGHSIFTDRITRSGPEISGRIKGATSELSTLFLRRVLHHGPLPSHVGGLDADVSLDLASVSLPDLRKPEQDIKRWELRYQDLLAQFVNLRH
jgi:dienelactone hydrolase